MTRSVIIADASPMIALARIGHLHLMRNLFGEVEITSTVRQEIVAGGHADAVPIEEGIQSGWVKVRSDFVQDGHLQESALLSGLDAGEKSSIQLALTHQQKNDPTLLVIDEVKGRRAARDLSLELIGSAGIIALAKRKGLISKAGILLEELQRSGYYLSDTVIQMALKIAGED